MLYIYSPWESITFCCKFNSKEESSVTSDENNFENSKVTGNISLIFKQNIFLLLKPTTGTTLHRYNYLNFSDIYVPTIVCSHEDKEDLETSNLNVKDVNGEQDERNEKELEPVVSILAAKVLEKTNPFTLQRRCSVCFSTASTNIICKCESIAYSVFASLASSTRLVIWFQYVTSGLCSGKLMTFISYLFTSGSE